MSTNTLEISNLSKSYGDFHLDNISFSLPKGYIMGLIGSNGSGKTTIIKIIMNLIMKQSGAVKIFGVDHLANEVEVKKRIGFVYDTPNYYDHLSLKQFKKKLTDKSLRGIVVPGSKNVFVTNKINRISYWSLNMLKIVKKVEIYDYIFICTNIQHLKILKSQND